MIQVRALLLVDVVDSTELAQTLGDASTAVLWAAHDRVARDLLAEWRGREIDKTDGFLLLFDSAAEAAGYALAYHRALARLDPPVQARAGLHVGPVLLRENSLADVARGAKPVEVEGVAKPTAARIMSLARGGQTLLSADARAAFAAGSGLKLQSHGHWHAKGLSEPIELFEVGEAGAVFTPPVDTGKVYRMVRKGALWVAAREIDNNLPHPVKSFVGREREVIDVMQALAQTRLLTVVGVGGLGKTRLGLQVATAVIGDFPDGAWLVELAPLGAGQQVLQAVASALRIKEEAGRPLADALLGHVKSRQLLIVLDNCEHLAQACASVAGQLLAAGPGVKILATSREPLHLAGEALYALSTLPVPDARLAATVDSLLHNEAARLFSERARAVQPSFRIDAGNAVAVAEICRRIDGIPLALELAAARVRSLPVETIAQRLIDRFRLLTGGDRIGLPRQRTLRALMDWSHDLLTEPERSLLRRLAVFAGGWTLDAAEAVAADTEIAPDQVYELLDQLVDRSLVNVETGGQRYRMLETVRAYAQERLDASADGGATRARHFAFFLALAQRAHRELWGAEQGAWVAQLDLERENILLAHAWCDRSGGDAEQGMTLIACLQLYWLPSGTTELGYGLTVQALERPGAREPTPARCGALYAAAQLAYFLARFADVQLHGERSLSIAREIGRSDRAVDALLMMAYAADELGQQEAALRHLDEAITLARQAGDKARISYALNALAAHESGRDPDASIPLYEESVALARAVGDHDSAAITLNNLARSLIMLGRVDPTRALLRESLQIAIEIGSKKIALYVFDSAAAVAVLRKEWAQAARLLGAADAQYERLGLRRMPGDEALLAPLLVKGREAMGPEAFAAEEAAARALGHEPAMAQAQAWLTGA